MPQHINLVSKWQAVKYSPPPPYETLHKTNTSKIYKLC